MCASVLPLPVGVTKSETPSRIHSRRRCIISRKAWRHVRFWLSKTLFMCSEAIRSTGQDHSGRCLELGGQQRCRALIWVHESFGCAELLLDVRVVDDNRLDVDTGTLGRGYVGLPLVPAPALGNRNHLETKASEERTYSHSVLLCDSFGHHTGSVQVFYQLTPTICAWFIPVGFTVAAGNADSL